MQATDAALAVLAVLALIVFSLSGGRRVRMRGPEQLGGCRNCGNRTVIDGRCVLCGYPEDGARRFVAEKLLVLIVMALGTTGVLK
jgi:hypothetical protein